MYKGIGGEFGSNAFTDGYIQSINSEKINYAREMLLGKAQPVDDMPCTTCSLYMQMRETGTYLTLQEIFPPIPLLQRMYHFFDRHPSLYYPARFAYRTFGLKRLVNWIRE